MYGRRLGFVHLKWALLRSGVVPHVCEGSSIAESHYQWGLHHARLSHCKLYAVGRHGFPWKGGRKSAIVPAVASRRLKTLSISQYKFELSTGAHTAGAALQRPVHNWTCWRRRSGIQMSQWTRTPSSSSFWSFYCSGAGDFSIAVGA